VVLKNGLEAVFGGLLRFVKTAGKIVGAKYKSRHNAFVGEV